VKSLGIDVVSDVICPWCYIGKRRLEKALALLEEKPAVRWLPFQLNPDMPQEGMPRSEYRAAKFGSLERARGLDARVAAEGAREGIAFAFERIERTPNTAAAHRLIALAQGQGAGAQVVEALFRAYFEEARDVGEESVLAGIAASSGVRGWPRAADAAGVAALEEEMRGHGISAVPTFIFNRRLAVAGAQPPEALAAAMRQALTRIPA
jgi:predicted DsbA family dithiol-disulfide isomerase